MRQQSTTCRLPNRDDVIAITGKLRHPAENRLLTGIVKRPACTLLLALLLSPSILLGGRSRHVEEHLIILNSSDATGSIAPQRVSSCLQQLVQEWKLDEQTLPRIMLIHASKQAATKVQVKEEIAVRKNGVRGEPTEYFEIWIVGEPKLRSIVIALQNVLESHYALHVTSEQRKAVIDRVIRLQDATIDVAEGK